MAKSKLEKALEEFRSFRRTLSPESQSILNAGLVGRLLAYIPEEKAIEAIHQSIMAWESQHMVIPVTQEEIYAQIQ